MGWFPRNIWLGKGCRAQNGMSNGYLHCEILHCSNVKFFQMWLRWKMWVSLKSEHTFVLVIIQKDPKRKSQNSLK